MTSYSILLKRFVASESGWWLHENFSVCCWMYGSGAFWYLILRLRISYLVM